MKFRAMSFNIHHGRGTDRRIDLERIAQVIEKSKADLIGLNEVDRRFSPRSAYVDQIAWLAGRLKMHEAYGPAISIQKGAHVRQFGNGLLSRYPITAVHNHPFDFFPPWVEGRSLLELTFELGSRIVKTYVTHLSLYPPFHRRQAHWIVHRAAKEKHPLLILGDWNRSPSSKAMQQIAHPLSDAWVLGGRGDGFTFPSLSPRLRLDYIWTNHRLHVESCEVMADIPEASDHLPVIADLKLN